ncbi:hypothetical protein H5410_054840 [Solanum commersonii]|uniref:Uncharacterized protein n=1 Tax=Solanum commersonii TaxID=4109 RepID=A0A9J5WGF5_SOLCO|nr:hypothetical protein H5410_054840 [Solanum commersonii]
MGRLCPASLLARYERALRDLSYLPFPCLILVCEGLLVCVGVWRASPSAEHWHCPFEMKRRSGFS